jgi:ubiquinone/menaquinone biosynthesis C-methylase UbiE
MNTFDMVAHDYEGFRALPEHVPTAVREAVRGELNELGKSTVLEVGCGTGRVGDAFAKAGDRYVGVDNSREMLDRFKTKLISANLPSPDLVLADGRALPFADASFPATLLVHVVSNVPGWQWLLREAQRVLEPNGILIVGQLARPTDGLDVQMNASLDVIAEALGMPPRRSKTQKHEARRELENAAVSSKNLTVANWQATRTPASFLARKPTGGRFAALDTSLRDKALERLADWAIEHFGSLDTPFTEQHVFTLDVYRF